MRYAFLSLLTHFRNASASNPGHYTVYLSPFRPADKVYFTRQKWDTIMWPPPSHVRTQVGSPLAVANLHLFYCVLHSHNITLDKIFKIGF